MPGWFLEFPSNIPNDENAWGNKKNTQKKTVRATPKIQNRQMNHAALFCVGLLAFVLGWWPERRRDKEWDGFSLCAQMITALPIENELLDIQPISVQVYLHSIQIGNAGCKAPPLIWLMEWLISSQLIPYLLPSDYHTSTQSAFILHFLAFLILCRPPPSLAQSHHLSLSLSLLLLNYRYLVCLGLACAMMAFQVQMAFSLVSNEAWHITITGHCS